MSLLLDALKRAEQEKISRGQAETARGPEAPRGTIVKPAAANPNLELQPIASHAPHAGSHGAPAGVARSDPGVVFHAKAPANEESRGRGMVFAAIGAIAVVAIGAGAYVWYSIQSLTGSGIRAAPRVQPPVSSPVASGTLASRAPLAPIAPAIPAAPTGAPPGAEPAPATVKAVPPTELRPSQKLAASVLAETPQAAAPPLLLDRSADAPRRIPAEVATGYEQLRSGNLAAARRSYTAALAADSSSIDAQLGLATVEARSGNRGAAAGLYRRVMDLDPRNGTAMAGLAALADFSRPEGLEEQLRADIARTPQSPALHFTLGNLYASQGRWNDAQAAYFDAHRLDPGGADIAYNLAVSLDHLGQVRLAADFYRRALESARVQAVQFDPAPVARRLAELR